MSMSKAIYDPVYTPSQRARLARMSATARVVFTDVLAAIQQAEEIGGPEGQDYLILMEAVMEEATERRDYCRDHIMD